MEAKTKKRIIIGVAVAAVALIAYLIFRPSDKEVTFKTQVIKRDTIETTVTATGSVEPVDEVTVGTQVSGIVQKIYVDYNSHVKKGQLLAELDQSTLQERLNQANATLQSALSALTLAKQTYTRTKGLYAQKAATKADMESAENSLTQSQSNVKTAQTNVNEAKVNLSYTKIYSPIDGVVLGKEIEEGQTVAASFSTPTLFTIARNMKEMQVEADIDEADIGSVKMGQKVTFTVDSYTDRTFSGTVKQIRMNPTTTNNVVTYTVIVSAPNPDEKLFPGMTADITIITAAKEDVVVPVSATNFTPTSDLFKALGRPTGKPNGQPGQAPAAGGNDNADSNSSSSSDADASTSTAKSNSKNKTVWVKNGNNIQPRNVTVGLGDGINYTVKSGLAIGDTVILSATVGKKEKTTSGSNPFMPTPPGKNNKSSK